MEKNHIYILIVFLLVLSTTVGILSYITLLKLTGSISFNSSEAARYPGLSGCAALCAKNNTGNDKIEEAKSCTQGCWRLYGPKPPKIEDLLDAQAEEEED